MKCKFIKMICCLLVLLFFAQNVQTCVIPAEDTLIVRTSPLTKEIVAEIINYFKSTNIIGYEDAERTFPGNGKICLSSGVQNSQIVSRDEPDFREIKAYNIPYMLSSNGDGHIPFLQAILSLYITSQSALQDELQKLQSEQEISKKDVTLDLLIAISNDLEQKYKDNTCGVRDSVEKISQMTGLPIEEAKTSCFSTFIYKSLADQFGIQAVQDSSLSLASLIISNSAAGVGFTGLISLEILKALGAGIAISGPLSSVLVPIGGIIIGVLAMAGGIASLIFNDRMQKYQTAEVNSIKTLLTVQRSQNCASLVKQIIGYFTNEELYSKVLNSNILVTAVDARRFFSTTPSDDEVLKCQNLRNDESWCDFVKLELEDSPLASKYTTSSQKTIKFLFDIFREVSISIGQREVINYEKLIQYSKGQSLPLEVRYFTKTQIDKLINLGISEEDIAQIVYGVTLDEIKKYCQAKKTLSAIDG